MANPIIDVDHHDDFDTTKVKEYFKTKSKEHIMHLFQISEEEYERRCKEYEIVFNRPMCAVIDDELALEAFGSNIIVLEDKFRTGYECKSCDGEGHTNKVCVHCSGSKLVAQNKEFNYGVRVFDEKNYVGLPPHFIEAQRKKFEAELEKDKNNIDSGGLMPCTFCFVRSRTGDFIPSGFETCKSCKGNCASLIVPEESMRRPSSGKIVSVGEMVGYDEKTGIKMPGEPLKCGDKVLYSNHTGYAMTFKQQTVFRTMHWYEVLNKVYGVGILSKKLR